MQAVGNLAVLGAGAQVGDDDAQRAHPVALVLRRHHGGASRAPRLVLTEQRSANGGVRVEGGEGGVVVRVYEVAFDQLASLADESRDVVDGGSVPYRGARFSVDVLLYAEGLEPAVLEQQIHGVVREAGSFHSPSVKGAQTAYGGGHSTT